MSTLHVLGPTLGLLPEVLNTGVDALRVCRRTPLWLTPYLTLKGREEGIPRPPSQRAYVLL